MKRRRTVLIGLTAIAVVVGGALLVPAVRFPPDTTPEGAYLRIASAIGGGEPEECFAYLEQDAQHAAYTIIDYSQKASELIARTYPEPHRTSALARYALAARCSDGSQLWARLAERRGWIARLRRDLSGVARVENAGERATVVTVRGTRYPFRRRPNGIWGLTIFTAELLDEAERLARDWDVIQQAAQDYQQSNGAAVR